jgi:hypothetical protein
MSHTVVREDELDRYRQAVEHRLGALLACAPDDELDRFFEHVEQCFERGTDPPACAHMWLALRKRPL